LREEGENRIKLSVRAIPGFDATVVATRFGGGGHKGAAGASFSCSLEEAAKLVEEAMLALNG
jgi:phosphoesterase RecJ-like protein